MPRPGYVRAEGNALALQRGDALAHLFGGPFDGRFGQGHVGHLPEQMTGPLEAVADAAGQGGPLLGGGRQASCADAGLLVEGEESLAAAPAVIVGAAAGDLACQAEEAMAAVAVVSGGVVAVRAGQAGPLVAVFICSRCCW